MISFSTLTNFFLKSYFGARVSCFVNSEYQDKPSYSFDSKSYDAFGSALQPYQPTGGTQATYSNYNVAAPQPQFTPQQPTPSNYPSQFEDSFNSLPPLAAAQSFTFAPPPTFSDFGGSQRHFSSPDAQVQPSYNPSSDTKPAYGGFSPYDPAPASYAQAPYAQAPYAQAPAPQPPTYNFQMTPDTSKSNVPTQQVFSFHETQQFVGVGVAQEQPNTGLDSVMKKLVNFDDISIDPMSKLSLKPGPTGSRNKAATPSAAQWGGSQPTLEQMRAVKPVSDESLLMQCFRIERYRGSLSCTGAKYYSH